MFSSSACASRSRSTESPEGVVLYQPIAGRRLTDSGTLTAPVKVPYPKGA